MRSKKLFLLFLAIVFIYSFQQISLSLKENTAKVPDNDNIFFEVTQPTVRAPNKKAPIYVVTSDIDTKKDTKLKKIEIIDQKSKKTIIEKPIV